MIRRLLLGLGVGLLLVSGAFPENETYVTRAYVENATFSPIQASDSRYSTLLESTNATLGVTTGVSTADVRTNALPATAEEQSRTETRPEPVPLPTGTGGTNSTVTPLPAR